MEKRRGSEHQPFRIVDVDETNRGPFCRCLEEWSDEMAEAGDHKDEWYDRVKDRGLGAKLALDEEDRACGMVQYVPAPWACLEGEGGFHVHCTWVHAYKGKGVGDQRKKGMGRALLKAAEADARKRGATGMSAWGIALPFWMKASWYKKQGYRVVDKEGAARLLWKPFVDGAAEPRWRRPKEKPESLAEKGEVLIISYLNGICPAMNIGHERMRKVAEEFGERVKYRVISTREPADLEKWGISDALYINGREVTLGPPPKEEKLRKLVRRELKKVCSANLR